VAWVKIWLCSLEIHMASLNQIEACHGTRGHYRELNYTTKAIPIFGHSRHQLH